MNKLPEHAVDLATHAMESTQKAIDTTQRAAADALESLSDSATKYIRHDPIKSILIAAATGAALMALIGLVTRPHGKR
jgi:ElaB/YqjD/DUF883 family membrane-anchored ribosome-binding protein